MRNDDLGCGGWIPLLPVFLSFPCEGLLEAARGAVFVHFRPCWSYFSSVSSPSEQPLSSDGAGVGSDRALAFLLADDAVVADAGEVELTRVAIN